jgi:hypothetical protein
MAKVEAVVYSSSPLLVRYKGDFLFNKLYSAINKWFKANRLKLCENKYKDKISDGKRLIEIKLYGDLKITEYYKHQVNVKIIAENYFERQVQVNGKKELIGNGKVLVEINGVVIADHKDLFTVKSKHNWVTNLYKWLGNLLFAVRKNEFAMKEIGALAGKLESLSNDVKHSLNMQSKI